MKRRWALRFLLFVGGIFAALVLVLRTEWAANELCTRAGTVIEHLVGEPLTMERCEIDPVRTKLVVTGLRFGSGEGSSPSVTARRLLIEVSPFSFGKRLSISRIEVDEPALRWSVAASEPGPGSPEEHGDCLAILDRFRLDALKIRGGSGEVLLEGGARSLRGEGIDLELRRRKRQLLPSLLSKRSGQGDAADREEEAAARRSDSYLLRFAQGSGRYEEEGGRAIPLESLEGSLRLEPAEEELEVERLEAKVPGLTLKVNGRITSICAPILDLALEAQGDLGVAGPLASLDEIQGEAKVQARLTGPVEALEATASVGLQGMELGPYAFGDLEAKLDYEPGKLRVNELLWPIEEGRVRIVAEIGLDADLATTVEVRTEGLEFQRLMPRLDTRNTPVMVTVDSVHRLSGRLAGGMLLEGTSSLELHGFRVRSVPWHEQGGTVIVEIPGRALLDTRVRLTATEIALDQARLSFGGGTTMDIAARLSFDEHVGMSIQARAPHFDLAHVGAHIARLPVGGSGELSATVEGPYSAPTIAGDIDFAGTAFYGAKLGRVRSHVVSLPHEHSLDFEGLTGLIGGTSYDARVGLLLGDHPTLEADLSIREGGKLEDVFEATADVLSPLAWLRDHLGGKVGSLEARIEGELPEVSGTATVEATEVAVMERPFDSLRTKVTVERMSSLEIEGFELHRGAGKAEGEARFDFVEGRPAKVQARVEAGRLPIRDLLGPFGEWAQLEGGVGATLQLGGTVADLEVSGEIGGERLAAAGVELAATRLSLETQGDQVIIRGALARAGLLSAAVRLADSLPFEARLELDVGDVSRFLPQSLGLGGEVRGTLAATGNLADLTASSGNISLSRLLLRSEEFQVESPGEVRFSFAGPSFVLQPLDLKGPNTQLSLQGNRLASGGYDLRTHGTFDARLVEKLLPQIEYAGGVIELQASLTGSGENPLLVGSAQIRDGTFRVKVLPIHVQGFQGKLAFSQNQVVVEEAQLGLNGGQATLRGTVSLGSWAPDRFDLTLDGRGMSWRMPADWPAVVSGRITFGGSWPDDLLLGGQLSVDRLRYAKDLELEKAILDFRRKVHAPTPVEEVERIRFDLDLIGGRDMRVDNNLVRARLQFVGSPGQPGRLKLVGSNVHLGLLGSVEVIDGIAFFRGNEYRLTHGMIDFSDRDRIDPTFDLTAETEVRDYRVAAHAYGRLGENNASGYQLDLRSEPMLAQADIVTLLTFGITSWDLDRGGNAALGAGVAAEALLAVSGLDEHVRRWLPQTPLFMDPDLSVTSQYSELTGQMEPMAVFETRVLTERLKLTAAAPFSTSKGRRASMEVKVNDRLSTQLVWQNEVVGYSSGDLGLDLKLRWEWE